MKVCICNNLNTELINSALEKVTDHNQVHAVLGCSIRCGRCLEYIKDIMERKKP